MYMKKSGYIFFAVFFIIFIFGVNNLDFYCSIIPGWHTTIYPLWEVVFFIMTLLILVILAIIIFLKLLKNVIRFFS